MLARRNQQHDAVVLALLPDPPGAAKLHAVVLDVVALERLHRRHHELVGGLFLELPELGIEPLGDRGGNDPGLVDDASRQRRKRRRRLRNRDEGQREERQRPSRKVPHDQNFTAGGVMFSAAMVNVSIGLAP